MREADGGQALVVVAAREPARPSPYASPPVCHDEGLAGVPFLAAVPLLSIVLVDGAVGVKIGKIDACLAAGIERRERRVAPGPLPLLLQLRLHLRGLPGLGIPGLRLRRAPSAGLLRLRGLPCLGGGLGGCAGHDDPLYHLFHDLGNILAVARNDLADGRRADLEHCAGGLLVFLGRHQNHPDPVPDGQLVPRARPYSAGPIAVAQAGMLAGEKFGNVLGARGKELFGRVPRHSPERVYVSCQFVDFVAVAPSVQHLAGKRFLVPQGNSPLSVLPSQLQAPPAPMPAPAMPVILKYCGPDLGVGGAKGGHVRGPFQALIVIALYR